MAKCTICGAEVAADAAFCPKCGAKLNRPGDIGPPPGTAPTTSEAAAADLQNARLRDHHEAGPRRVDTAEKDLWSGTFSAKAMIGPMIGGVFLTIGVAVVWYLMGERIAYYIPLAVIALTWLYLVGALLIRQWSVRYRLTNQRFFHERGILRRTVDRIEVIDMDDITFSQGIFDRLLGTGTIKVTSSDRTHPELHLLGIDNVREVAAMIDAARREERIRRGLHIEQI